MTTNSKNLDKDYFKSLNALIEESNNSIRFKPTDDYLKYLGDEDKPKRKKILMRAQSESAADNDAPPMWENSPIIPSKTGQRKEKASKKERKSVSPRERESSSEESKKQEKTTQTKIESEKNSQETETKKSETETKKSETETKKSEIETKKSGKETEKSGKETEKSKKETKKDKKKKQETKKIDDSTETSFNSSTSSGKKSKKEKKDKRKDKKASNIGDDLDLLRRESLDVSLSSLDTPASSRKLTHTPSYANFINSTPTSTSTPVEDTKKRGLFPIHSMDNLDNMDSNDLDASDLNLSEDRPRRPSICGPNSPFAVLSQSSEGQSVDSWFPMKKAESSNRSNRNSVNPENDWWMNLKDELELDKESDSGQSQRSRNSDDWWKDIKGDLEEGREIQVGSLRSSSSSIATNTSSTKEKKKKKDPKPNSKKGVIKRLRDEAVGLPVATRKFNLISYSKSFEGRELVTWLIDQGVCKTREEATGFASMLLEERVFTHVNNEKLDFKDSPLLYRFTWDETKHSPEKRFTEHFIPDNYQEIVDALQDPKTALKTSDRSQLLATYPKVFEGAEFITWLITNNFAENRSQGLELGESIRLIGTFACVRYGVPLKDDATFYRFSWDARTRSRSHSITGVLARSGPVTTDASPRKGIASIGKKGSLRVEKTSSKEKPEPRLSRSGTGSTSIFQKLFGFGSKSKEKLPNSSSNRGSLSSEHSESRRGSQKKN